ncbi:MULTISPECIES: rhodanese-like domain-containing protein [Roseateles]|uniref:Rhodanese-like domain-containing protein n=1 Tax=Roseateles albus TaxID=2987525 RepID=A0ABT5KJH3_9BURK|nr:MULTISPECIES: rhodanese-like domain-containing protein [Roseateles]MCV2358008.1 sulfurtransferase [Paucibacter sp. TC2R-5]MDC8773659.1 rhodanese-like domain-containing protein [Roseateles albus]
MRQIGSDELLAMCAGSHPPVLLDVREPWEAQLSRIVVDGLRSELIPMGQIPARVGELDRAQPIVCYCHHGVRSLQVVAFLLRAGFDSVYNLAGGIDAWSLSTDPSVPRY